MVCNEFFYPVLGQKTTSIYILKSMKGDRFDRLENYPDLYETQKVLEIFDLNY